MMLLSPLWSDRVESRPIVKHLPPSLPGCFPLLPAGESAVRRQKSEGWELRARAREVGLISLDPEALPLNQMQRRCLVMPLLPPPWLLTQELALEPVSLSSLRFMCL